MSDWEQDIINFGPGPSKIPDIKQRLAQDILNYAQTGLSILEIGHRSTEFMAIVEECRQALRDLIQIPPNYQILFLQGGACGQFAAIPMNLFGKLSEGERRADYLITGAWSAKAAKEASKYGKIREICPQIKGYNRLPDPNTYEYDPKAAYVYFCDNETISGLEFQQSDQLPQPPSNIPIVCDMCSSFTCKPVDVSKYGILFSGSQKNMGCAGITVVIIRNDLISTEMESTPSIMSYRIQLANNSVYNTPPTFSLYAVNQTLRWMLEQGGISEMEKRSIMRSQAVYSLVDESGGFYKLHPVKEHRSRFNIVLNLRTPELEKLFVDQARHLGLVGLKGHRSVGGLRISLYNAITMPDVERLLDFMKVFMTSHADEP